MSPTASAPREVRPKSSPKRLTPRSGPVERVKPAAAAEKPATAASAPAPQGADVPDVVVQMLDSYNFTYELTDLPLSAIDRKASQTNQARIENPIDEDQVILYAEAMKRGDIFPPIVVYMASNGKYIVMDGNHRVASADLCDIETFRAYIVKDPAPAQVQAFTYEANTKHGKPTNLKDRVWQAIHLVNRQTHTAKEAAAQLGIPVGTLRSAIDQQRADRRFETLGIRKLTNLSANARRRLDSIHSDVVLEKAAELVLDAGIGGETLQSFLREVNSYRKEREALAFIASERERRASVIKATAGGRMPLKQSLVTFARMTSTINNMNIDGLIRDLSELPADLQADHAKAAAETVTRLMTVVRTVQQHETRS